ncbi:hypothetical protein, partial [Pseudomonas aeruginosa]|uniref:hypothetical protein n=1 Tax=Pseudomonas aeruginosa TaxID=287 RepID=UPI003CC5F8DC
MFFFDDCYTPAIKIASQQTIKKKQPLNPPQTTKKKQTITKSQPSLKINQTQITQQPRKPQPPLKAPPRKTGQR